MHYAIIAAGEGSRLRQEGVVEPKPLVQIQGLPMVDRLMGLMSRCNAESISIICNETMPEVCQHLREVSMSVDIHLITGQTPSSMHSLARLSEVIPEGKVIITTVDTIFREADFAAYVERFEHSDDALFAVTPFVDDEKPLWVSVDFDDVSVFPAVTAFCDRQPSEGRLLVSGGIYGLDTRKAWPVLHRCIREGQSRMRNYQRALLAAGVAIRACVFPHIMDIDHASDIQLAEQWLRTSAQGCVLSVRRALEHSPNNVSKDAAILTAVSDRLMTAGVDVKTCSEDEISKMDLTSVDAIVHMARGLSSLTRLSTAKISVINQPRSVMSVAHSREYTLSVLQEAGVKVSPWWAFDPEQDDMFQCDDTLQALLPGWVKATRPDGARPGDVMWVATPLEADSRVIELAAEQVPDIVVTRHIEGDLLKVYCVVADGMHPSFLKTFYPQEMGYSKFGEAESHNTPLVRTPYQMEEVQAVAVTIARALGLQVFGFDAVVLPDGTFSVIDVNDWPSFSCCHDEAADAIANMIVQSLNAPK